MKHLLSRLKPHLGLISLFVLGFVFSLLPSSAGLARDVSPIGNSSADATVLIIQLSDTSIDDATLTWRRQAASKPGGALSIDSGDLTYNSAEEAYVSVAFSVELFAEGVCSEASAVNQVELSVKANGNDFTTSINVCSGQENGRGYVRQTVDIGTVQETGSIVINFVDTNGEFTGELKPVGYDPCTLRIPGGTSISCEEAASNNQLSYDRAGLRLNNLPVGDYRLVAGYDFECRAGLDNCTANDDAIFEEQTVSFTLEPGVNDPLSVEASLDPDPPPPPDDVDEDVKRRLCSGLIIGYILCPIAEVTFQAIKFVYDTIFLPVLITNPIEVNGSESNQAVYATWNNIRIVSNILLIGVFVLAAIGQAFSWFFTPYELKKIVPRLAIGTIGIQLSWFFSSFLIDVFNVIGGGIRALILLPIDDFQALNFDFSTLFGEGSIFAFLGETAAAAAVGGASAGGVFLAGGAKGVLWLLPMILVPGLILILGSVFVVLIRQLALVVLVILSPLAFVAWILPNTQGITKQWLDLFVKLLIVYPLIVALVAVGELAAVVLILEDDVSGRVQTARQIGGLAAFFAPYILIPTTFRYASSITGNVVSGFDSARQNISHRMFGDIRDRNSYRGKAADHREMYKQQRAWSSISRNNALVNAMSSGIGSDDFKKWAKRGGTPGRFWNRQKQDGRNLNMSKRGRPLTDRAQKYRGLARGIGGVLLGNTIRRPAQWASRRTATPIDWRFAQRTKAAKQGLRAVTGLADDESVWALFGDYHPYEKNADGTPRRLRADAINAAKTHRRDQAYLNPGLGYLFTQAKSNSELQSIINNFVGNPFGLDEALMFGVWKGATFQQQGQRRDLKFRTSNADESGMKPEEFIQNKRERQLVDHQRKELGKLGLDDRLIRSLLGEGTLRGGILDDRNQLIENIIKDGFNDQNLRLLAQAGIDTRPYANNPERNSELIQSIADKAASEGGDSIDAVRKVLEPSIDYVVPDKAIKAIAKHGVDANIVDALRAEGVETRSDLAEKLNSLNVNSLSDIAEKALTGSAAEKAALENTGLDIDKIVSALKSKDIGSLGRLHDHLGKHNAINDAEIIERLAESAGKDPDAQEWGRIQDKAMVPMAMEINNNHRSRELNQWRESVPDGLIEFSERVKSVLSTLDGKAGANVDDPFYNGGSGVAKRSSKKNLDYEHATRKNAHDAFEEVIKMRENILGYLSSGMGDLGEDQAEAQAQAQRRALEQTQQTRNIFTRKEQLTEEIEAEVIRRKAVMKKNGVQDGQGTSDQDIRDRVAFQIQERNIELQLRESRRINDIPTHQGLLDFIRETDYVNDPDFLKANKLTDLRDEIADRFYQSSTDNANFGATADGLKRKHDKVY